MINGYIAKLNGKDKNFMKIDLLGSLFMISRVD